MPNSSDNNKKMEKGQFQVNRRTFLKAGATAAAMGLMGAIRTPGKVVDAAAGEMNFKSSPSGQWSKLHPKIDYGGASVSFVENNDQWLGTTKIVGKVEKYRECDMGFFLAARGLLGEKATKAYDAVPDFINKAPTAAAISKAFLPFADDNMVDGPAAPEKLPIPDPEQMSRHIKDFAYFLRADEVGIGKMPEYAYYSHRIKIPVTYNPILLAQKPIEECIEPITSNLPYVIVVMIDQDLETMMASTGYDGISGSQSFMAYEATANVAVIMAEYIRSLGYNARAHHCMNYNAVVTPALMAAGMGELSRTGDCAVHPRLGFRHKAALITTDLPLVPDKPIDFGLQDFCRVCKKCAENCPSQAITLDKEPVEHNGYLRYNSDMKKCTMFRVGNEEGSSCGRCMKVCPWNSKEDSWFHELGVWVGSKGEMSSSLLKQVDDMFGYGTETIDKYKWWLEWPELYHNL